MSKVYPIVILLLCLSFCKASAQVFYLNNGFANGDTVRTCAGIFKDAGGLQSYRSDERYIVSFISDRANLSTQLTFDTLSLGQGDTLKIFDGLSVAAPLLAILTREDGPTALRGSSQNISGALTVQFSSDVAVESTGWSARINCRPPCQKIIANILNTVPARDAQGFVNICTGQQVTFSATGSYPENGLYYYQNDSINKFRWKLSNGRDTVATGLKTFSHAFVNEGGYSMELTITDTSGCVNREASIVKIRTGLRPAFNIQNVTSGYCAADSIKLFAKPRMQVGTFLQPPVIADSIALPDGLGACYQTSLNITQFAPGQTFNALSDLIGINLNMEHSWLGDLEISITAPNGTKVRLKYSVGTSAGWETFLGEPVDEPAGNSALASLAGIGYNYLFSPAPTYGTMAFERGKYRYNYINTAGQSVTNKFYLPAGSYASEENLSALLGTPLNGQWTIEVCDRYAIDNGFIFNWSMRFNPLLFPSAEIYQPTFGSGVWTPRANQVNTSDTTVTVILNNPGTYPYTYSVTDTYGCQFDTTFAVIVNPRPSKPQLGNDTTLCDGQIIPLTIINPEAGVTYTWSNNATGNNITTNQQGIFSVTAANNFGCRQRDTITVNRDIPFTINLGNDTMYCASNPNVLSVKTTESITAFDWSTGSNNSMITIASMGKYWVKASNALGCYVVDSIVISNNPINNYMMPGDTIICAKDSYLLNLSPPPASIITWNDGSTGNTFLVNKGGTYSISANYVGCVKTDDMIVSIKPLPQISLGADTTLCMGFDLPITASYPGATYRWSTGATDSFIVAKASNIYWAEASYNGCTYRDSINFQLKNCLCEIIMPNAFSPNGDGINDFYTPAFKCFPKNYSFSVFNRYGQAIYNTKDFKHKWDGTLNGKALPVATYYYILTYYNDNLQQNEKLTGSITILK